MPPWCRCSPILPCRSASRSSASRSRRSRSNRRKPCGLSRKPRPSAGGRSSRRPTSRWSRGYRRRHDGLDLLQLLQTAGYADHRGHRRIRKTGLPVGDADLADIDVALGIQRDAVRREEFAALEAGTVLAAELRDALSLGIDDAQARTEIRHLAVDRHARAELADDEIGRLAAAAMQRAGPVQVIPLRLV